MKCNKNQYAILFTSDDSCGTVALMVLGQFSEQKKDLKSYGSAASLTKDIHREKIDR